jgi:hypothetical protein
VTHVNVAGRGTNAAGATTGRGTFHRVKTGGPSLADISAASQTPITKVSLVHASQPGGGTLADNKLALYAPHVNPTQSAQPKQVASSIGLAEVNRGTDITQPLRVNSRFTPALATEAQVNQARIAQNNAPSDAKVVTATSTFRPVLQGPLTTLTPTARQVNSPIMSQNSPSPNRGIDNGGVPSNGFTPSTRTYPGQNGVPSNNYRPANGNYPNNQQHSELTPNNGGSGFHPTERPAAPTPSAPSSGGSGRASGSGNYQGSGSGSGAAAPAASGGTSSGGGYSGGAPSGGSSFNGGGAGGGGGRGH